MWKLKRKFPRLFNRNCPPSLSLSNVNLSLWIPVTLWEEKSTALKFSHLHYSSSFKAFHLFMPICDIFPLPSIILQLKATRKFLRILCRCLHILKNIFCVHNDDAIKNLKNFRRLAKKIWSKNPLSVFN